MERSGRVSLLREGYNEATGEGKASVVVNTLANWRCHDHGMTTKDSSRDGVELT